MMKIQKIYIDSKFRTSGTSSNFAVELPQTVELNENMKCHIHEITIPHSWYSIHSTNNNFYFRHQVLPPSTPNGITYRKIVVPEGTYTPSNLSSTIQTLLNTLVDGNGRTNTYTFIYNSSTNKISIASNYADVIFFVLTDNDITQAIADVASDPIDINNLNSINKVIGNIETAVDASTQAVPYISGFVDLQPVKNVYIQCNDLCNYNQLTIQGFAGIVKKVPITSGFGGVVFDNEILHFDNINCSNKILRNLNFKLTDENYNLLEMNNVDVSFSITFYEG